MIHELLPTPTETAFGSHPRCLVSISYDEPKSFHGGNTGSNPVGDANKKVVYASTSLALAAIETFVNLEPNLRPDALVSIECAVLCDCG